MGLTITRETGGGEQPTISLCMIVKDEEESLARCLKSAEPAVDEMIIVDTGSSDRSVEIAESFGATVLHEEWKGDFAGPRNTSIDAATGDWILYLDADEELIDGAALRELVRGTDLEGFSLREVNFIGDDVGVEFVVNSAFRLFRNRPEYRFEGALHEQIMGKVDPEGGVTTAFCGVEIQHYGYLDPTSEARNKTERNMDIVLEEVRRKPDDSFTLFNAGVEHQRVGRNEEALHYFQRAFATLPSLRAYYASLLLRNIVATLNSLERYDEALDVLTDALEAYPDFTDMHYLQGQIHASRREYRAAIRSFRRAIDLGDHGGDRYLAQSGMGSFYSWHALGALHHMMGDANEAVRCFKTSVSTAPGFYAPPLSALTQLLLDSDPPDEVLPYVSGLIDERRRADSLRVISGVFLRKGHPDHALRLVETARDLSPDDAGVRIAAADCHIHAGDLDAARAELTSVPVASELHPMACSKRVLVGILAGDTTEAAEAADGLSHLSNGLYTLVYRAASSRGMDDAPPRLPADLDRESALDIVFELAGTLLDLNRLDEFNPLIGLMYALASSPNDVNERLGLLLAHNDFPDPAADRLLAAVEAGVAGPDALSALGHICASKDLPEDAEVFLRAALEADDQSMARYLALTTHIARLGRYDEAREVVGAGLAVWPHSTVLRELRDSFGMLAQSPSLN